jgi:hypothetical protein
MARSQALIAMLVVACKPRHELLAIGELTGCNFGHELSRVYAPQRGCQLATVTDFDLACFSKAKRKT